MSFEGENQERTADHMDSLTSRTAVVHPVVTESDPIRAQLCVHVLSLFRASHGWILTCTCAHRDTPGLPLSIKGLIVCLVQNSVLVSFVPVSTAA